MTQPILVIKQGKLKGETATDVDGNSYSSFRGIPYAKPPIGKHRFKDSVPLDNWKETLDATREGYPCYARDLFTKQFIGSENCLTLNVFTRSLPEATKKGLKPVMVWIHGGVFLFGSSTTDVYGPDFLLTEDVVIVSINYRLGILGFLSLDDPSLGVPGNAGLKDMVLALKWVQRNISEFNGDPDNVTIFGGSAGGASVHLLMLSPMAKGLFHKAIAQSGCALNPWAQTKRNAKLISQAVGQGSFDEAALLQHLVGLPIDQLLAIQEKVMELNPDTHRPFGPVIENTIESAFLDVPPIDIILSGNFNQVPFMVGYTTAEGMILGFFRNINEALEEDFQNHVPHLLGYQRDSKESIEVVKKLTKFYYGNEKISKENIEKFYKMESDESFIYGINVMVTNHVMKSKKPIYLYRMSIESSLNFFKKIGKITESGVCHADDLGYLFKNFETPLVTKQSVEDIAMRRFVKLWANFARYGNPTPNPNDPLFGITWKPVEEQQVHFLDIGQQLIVGINPEAERVAFWRKIYQNSPRGSKILPQ